MDEQPEVFVPSSNDVLNSAASNNTSNFIQPPLTKWAVEKDLEIHREKNSLHSSLGSVNYNWGGPSTVEQSTVDNDEIKTSEQEYRNLVPKTEESTKTSPSNPTVAAGKFPLSLLPEVAVVSSCSPENAQLYRICESKYETQAVAEREKALKQFVKRDLPVKCEVPVTYGVVEANSSVELETKTTSATKEFPQLKKRWSTIKIQVSEFTMPVDYERHAGATYAPYFILPVNDIHYSVTTTVPPPFHFKSGVHSSGYSYIDYMKTAIEGKGRFNTAAGSTWLPLIHTYTSKELGATPTTASGSGMALGSLPTSRIMQKVSGTPKPEPAPIHSSKVSEASGHSLVWPTFLLVLMWYTIFYFFGRVGNNPPRRPVRRNQNGHGHSLDEVARIGNDPAPAYSEGAGVAPPYTEPAGEEPAYAEAAGEVPAYAEAAVEVPDHADVAEEAPPHAEGADADKDAE